MTPASELVSLKGRRAVVTGAAAGIGKAIALRLAEAGAAVHLVDVDAPGLEVTSREVAARGPEVRAHTADLSSKEAIDRLWAEMAGGSLPDTLVNNAGVYPMRDFLEVDEAFLSRTLRVNLESALWMCQAFIRRRRGRGGVIVNVSSIEAVLAFKSDMVPYGISKAGVLALTRGLARDYGRHGFRVNAILPGAIRTPGTEALMKKAVRGLRVGLLKAGYDFQARLALGRWGAPDEVARVVLFLVSDLAAYVHGAALPVDGGFLSS